MPICINFLDFILNYWQHFIIFCLIHESRYHIDQGTVLVLNETIEFNKFFLGSVYLLNPIFPMPFKHMKKWYNSLCSIYFEYSEVLCVQNSMVKHTVTAAETSCKPKHCRQNLSQKNKNLSQKLLANSLSCSEKVPAVSIVSSEKPWTFHAWYLWWNKKKENSPWYAKVFRRTVLVLNYLRVYLYINILLNADCTLLEYTCACSLSFFETIQHNT